MSDIRDTWRLRSFVRREGRLTPGQQRAMDELYPQFACPRDEPVNFSTLFGNDNPVILEIGFGMGDSLAEMAKAHPDFNYLGIEVHRPGVGRLLSLVEEQGLTNVRVICHDAVEVLEQNIANHSLHGLQLFFPDPWHKKRHHKRRIVKADWVNLISSKLENGGFLHMATDWENYAEHMQEVLSEFADFALVSTDKPHHRPETKFERRGIKLGHGVWDLIYKLSKEESSNGVPLTR